ncbi:unnamed protein product [Cylindrotheca closterium]|uniref:Exostosin GT47 domain-containing protein n=1 Tax=Cylindrotheca closterium TaxID=2856 RepID=A0AAD2JLG2_9STRA|nr:unnamed protein product [Cylindrotheca closterium]
MEGERNRYKVWMALVALLALFGINSIRRPLMIESSSSSSSSSSCKTKERQAIHQNKEDTSDPPEVLLSVPFYVYEEWSWLNSYWIKENGNNETVEHWSTKTSDDGHPYYNKHGDDFWFLRNAMKHPMRTTDISTAKLFFVPTLLNQFDWSLRRGKRNICFNKDCCKYDLIQRTQQYLNASEAFRLYPERHVIVRSYFTPTWKNWDVRKQPSEGLVELRESYRSFFFEMVPKMQAIVFEGKDFADTATHQVPRLGRHILPTYYVGSPCLGSPSNKKTLDIAMIATMKGIYDGRKNLCRWLNGNPNVKSICGKGERCPALADAKFGFHVAGDTFGSQRLMDVLLSGTVPIFSHLDQYTIQGDWIDWDQLSYYIPLHNDTTAYSEDPVTRFSMTNNSVEKVFNERLRRVLDDEEGYRKRQKAVIDHLEFFDMRTIYPFDTYMYLFQAELYPETRHTRSRWSALIMPPPLFSNSLKQS